MKEHGISTKSLYTSLSDQGLDNQLAAIKARVPQQGFQTCERIATNLRRRVQWQRIKGSMPRIDAAGVLSRITHLGCTVRPTYSVQGPRSLVHIDENHKLKRYNMVIFGSVDGYSRNVMYLNAANDNKSRTALSFFLESVQQFVWALRYVKSGTPFRHIAEISTAIDSHFEK
ncbi:hypothetical protein F2P81_025551 [Scophthalmus maximus]|uniref:Integrase core domain-containing protein n=1 Tax=Scophthalmus maximus TaxID=52904 RepID=A0A6A4RIA6_SCOMX|nr:hypothetical protein F2P81_025551 [Scophthalmus maximus]